MHIMEGYLPPLFCAVWTAASAPAVVQSVRSTARIIAEKRSSLLLLGAAGGFCFVLSALKLPSVTGSSSHPTGIGLGAILFGPWVMVLVGDHRARSSRRCSSVTAVSPLSAPTPSPWPSSARSSRTSPGGWRGDTACPCPGRVPGRDVQRPGHVHDHLGTARVGLSGPGWAACSVRSRSSPASSPSRRCPLAIVEGLLTMLVVQSLLAHGRADLQGTAPLDGEAPTPVAFRRVALAGGLGVLIVVVAAVLVSTGVLGWAGADDRARLAVQSVRPGYQPWFHALWKPGTKRVESLLFALQAAIGLAAIGLYVRHVRRRRRDMSRREQSGGLNLIDSAAHSNRLARVSAVEKMTFAAGLLLLALVLPPVPGDLFVIAAAVIATLAVARVPGGVYAKAHDHPADLPAHRGGAAARAVGRSGGPWLVRPRAGRRRARAGPARRAARRRPGTAACSSLPSARRCRRSSACSAACTPRPWSPRSRSSSTATSGSSSAP